MRVDEWDTLQQLDAEIFDPHDHLSEEFFNKRVTMPGFFAMETKTGNLIGYLILGQFTDEIAHLGRIGVKKNEQSQGLGSQLMEYAIDWFRHREGV